MASVRNALGLVGKSASLRHLAQQRNAAFPLSLRDFVGAPPPGRIVRKTVSLDFLQRKFDEIVNHRAPPLFLARLDSKKKKHGQSALSLAMVDRNGQYDLDDPFVSGELAGPGERLSFDVGLGGLAVTYYFYFQDLRTDRISLTVLRGEPAGLEIAVHFETSGPIELKVDGVFPDINLTGLNIKLKLEFGSANRLLSLSSYVEAMDQALQSGKVAKVPWANPADPDPQYQFTTSFLGSKVQVTGFKSGIEAMARRALKDAIIKRQFHVDVSVDARGLPDGTVAGKIENTLVSKLFDAWSDEKTRAAIDMLLTRFIVGGDFPVTGVASDGQALTVDYIVPPGQLEPFPENPQPPLDPGALANIDHIVVLMMENRSFDHMLGYLSKDKGRSDIDGLKGDENNRYAGKDYQSFELPDTNFFQSPPHSHGPVESQINGGKMDGFVAAFAQKFAGAELDPGRVMGYHPAAHVPVYDALASQFMVCQRWFAAHPGPTFCNRFYTVTGRLNRNAFGLHETDNPHLADFQPVKTKTLFDHLADHGVSWHYYESRYCFLRLFERYTLDDAAIVDFNDPVKGFLASARAGTLPAVSFIDPNFVDEPDEGDNDDGPPADIRAGQHLIGSIVNAVMNGPQWHKTLLVITYDEHGGFYDHVNPREFSANARPVSGIDYYGARVPAFVVSPWVDAGAACNVVFDHTSIPKTIVRRFLGANPPDLGERVAAANDLSAVLRSSPRTDTPSIPIPPRPQANALTAKLAAENADADDFKEIMRAMRKRYPLAGRV